MKKKYVIISPCRDESEYMLRTLESVANQSLPPDKWVIVDDGSTDRTPEILADYATRFDFIQVVTRKNRGFRKVGGGVIDAFYEGYAAINPDDYDYVCKLDLDLDIPERYFEILVSRMEENPRIATCSGKPYNEINGQMVSEKRGDEMSVGMTKFYRMSAFQQIGGFVPEVMWDAIDCHRCRQMGWHAWSWDDDPQLRFNHLRMMGSSQTNILVGRMRHGFGQYYMGTGFIYMVATSVFRAAQPPYIIGGAAMLWGYIKSLISGKPKFADPELRKFIRKFQWACLIHGKARAIEIFDARQAANWSTDREPIPMPVMQS